MAFLTEAANRGSIATGYDIDNSVKLEQPERVSRAYDGGGNIGSITATDRKRTTLSYWVKRTQLNASGNGIVFIMYAGNTIMLGFEQDKLRVSSEYGYSLISNALFRDTSAWYNLVFSIDSTQGTANDRVKVYVNGAEYTDWGTQTITISQNANNGMFNEVNGSHYFGWGDSQATGCYVAEAHCIDGQALAASDFGEYDAGSGIWKPKEYDGTYGNQGYYLDFKNASNLGQDQSGNSNNFGSLYGIGSENQATDTPTNNFAIGNVLTSKEPFLVTTEGATKGVLSTSGPGNNTGGVSLVSTLAPSRGKWYFEAQNTNSGDVYLYLGVADTGSIAYTDGKVFGGSGSNPSVGWRGGGANDGKVYINNSATGTADTWETEVVGVALDLDNSKIYFHKSGTYINSGDPANGTDNGGQYDLPTAVDGQWYLGFSAYNLATWHINFGGYTTMSISSAATDANGYGTFEYAPPTGYYALCTKNLAEFG
jgi:hypothetical protein